ncbi:M24 family metallopeptidase [Alloyangia pacifica]|uniref:M24 family metallopeptidase n=1 Tax=Alloyangia pacifica TaxID=311180 RepID=UPI001CD7F9A2|nr:Xaa-Pro peptidase family protein [Alloyangia pacifica]MCA0996493.1 Xaa-Pro peptidase family protein [Alloyangia pacifica]
MDQSVATRGFFPSEYHSRLERAQARMAMSGISALLLTTEPEVRYFTGFLTRFWESPTRPWFLVVPAEGDPVAVVPSIGAHLMAQSWITDIRCWSSPDYEDDGISLLAEALAEAVPPGEWVGVPSGGETHLRMPLTDWEALKHRLPDRLFGPDAGIMRKLRMVKSEAEIACIRAACDVGTRAFARLPEILRPGVPLSEVFRRFQILALEEGADWVPYLAGAAGPDGYGDVISPASQTPLCEGDVLMLDTGLMRDGYFCDFDRNISLGTAAPGVLDAHARLLDAVQAGFAAARPGARANDLFRAMAAITGGSDVGRLGHGLGMQLTEPPSLIAADDTRLEPGMVLTLEPGIALSPSHMLVHEEDIVITETGAEWLTTPATSLPEVPV